MFYSLMLRRSFKEYRRNYISLFLTIAFTLAMLAFFSIYLVSMNNWDDIRKITAMADWTCDIRVIGITEKEAESFYNIDNTEMTYINGALDIDVIDKTVFSETQRMISDRFTELFGYDESKYGDKTIYIYYGNEYEIEDGTYMTESMAALQAIFSVAAIMAIVLIYTSFIKRRYNDIRTLLSVGIKERQLSRLFFIEFSILYIAAVLVGIPVGCLFVFMLSKPLEYFSMTDTTWVYPIFKLDAATLICDAVLGYIVVYIAYRIMLLKLLRIDAVGNVTSTMPIKKYDRTRGYYRKALSDFVGFFSGVLRKRRIPILVSAVIISVIYQTMSVFLLYYANSVFVNSLNMPEYLIVNDTPEARLAEFAGFMQNVGLTLFIFLFAAVYIAIIFALCIKQYVDAYGESISELCQIGADVGSVCKCFIRVAVRCTLVSITIGTVLSFVLYMVLIPVQEYIRFMNIFVVLAFAAYISAFVFLAVKTVKREFARFGVINERGNENADSGS